MEHLFSKPSLPAKIRIPYRECNRVRPYGGEARQGYLERYSYSADQIVANYSTPLPDGRHEFFLCLIQNYCFFAFLRECFHMFDGSFSQSDFVRQDGDGGKWLSTSSLPTHAHQICVARAYHVIGKTDERRNLMEAEAVHDTSDSFLAFIGASNLDVQTAKTRLQQIWDLCNAQNRFLERLQFSLARRREFLLFDDEDFQLIIACATLTETMWSFIKQLFPPEARKMLASLHINSTAIDLHARLNKWCPNRIANLAPGPSLAALLITSNSHDQRIHGPEISQILSKLKRNGRDDKSARRQLYKLYSELRTGEDESCTDKICFKSIHVSEDMEPFHRCRDARSSCIDVPIDQSSLSQMYLEAHFPILAFDTEPKVVSYTSDTKF